ncbi:hypothetical protein MANI_028352 [Metarhizium anisopliae]|nr:hypothetical protein MANI_028352 [Metarhizium anisopliae]
MNHQPGASAGLPVGTSQSMDEAQLNQAMKRLKLLYIKARLLRDTIPKMLDPLVQKQPSLSDAQMDVKEFTELMRDETTKQVFAQAEKSRQDNPLGIKQWRHKDHPDWFKMDKD